MIYLCKPWAAGERRTNELGCKEVYVYDGSLSRLKAVDLDRVPHAVGQGDEGGQYKFLRENGWLLEFNPIRGPREVWAAFYLENDLVIDVDDGCFHVERDNVKFDVQVFFVFAKIILQVKKRNLTITRLIFFPWSRVWFIDNDDLMECLPITHLFSDLKASKGRAFWKKSWSQGLRCISGAISFSDPIEWSHPP